MNIICAWCLQRNATHELVIYKLQRSKSIVANGEKTEMILRGDKYLSVRLCKQCLPATSLTDFARELQEDSDRRRKEKHIDSSH